MVAIDTCVLLFVFDSNVCYVVIDKSNTRILIPDIRREMMIQKKGAIEAFSFLKAPSHFPIGSK